MLFVAIISCYYKYGFREFTLSDFPLANPLKNCAADLRTALQTTAVLGSNTMNWKTTGQRRKAYVYV